MFSFWEKAHLLHSDILIIGSGITGLSTACTLRERRPDLDITVLERGLLPTGASSKNAGFACIGSLTEKQYDLTLMGEDRLIQLISDRYEGLLKLRHRLGDANIDYQSHGGFELITGDRRIADDEIAIMNKRLMSVFNKPVFRFANDRISSFGFNGVNQLILNDLEGQLNTGLMMKNLLHYANSIGVRIITGAEVESFHNVGDQVEAITSQGTIFKAEQLVICTNAFTKIFLPDEEIIPGRGQVLITNEIENLPFKGIFNFDEGFYYFRNFGNRILFGGGRNLDFEGETTTALALNDQIQAKLEYYLRNMIVPNKSFTITDRWSGIMAFGKEKLPLIKRINDQVTVGARLNGMGVALGSKIGEDLASLVLEQI